MLLSRLSGLPLNSATVGTADNIPLPHGLVRMPDIPENFLIKTLDVVDKKPEKSRIGKPGYTHVSSLIGGCVRQYVLATRFNVEILESVTGGHRVMWRIGRAVETHVRDSFLEGQGNKGVYGRWKCKCGRVDHLGLYPSRGCNCQNEPLKYFEPVLYDEENKLVGSPDMTLIMGNFFFTPVEVKSMNKEDFDDLTAPLPDHIAQAASYRRLYQLQGRRVHDKVIIIYTKKEFKWGSPYKEFHVDCTSDLVQGVVQTIVDKGAQIANSVAASVLPERHICQSASNPLAKKCPVAHLCWGMN